MVRTVLLYLLEILAALTVLYGVALVYVPAALILGGLAAIAVLERATAAVPPTPRKEARR